MNKRVLGIGGISCLIISVIFTILSTNALQVDGTSLDFLIQQMFQQERLLWIEVILMITLHYLEI